MLICLSYDPRKLPLSPGKNIVRFVYVFIGKNCVFCANMYFLLKKNCRNCVLRGELFCTC